MRRPHFAFARASLKIECQPVFEEVLLSRRPAQAGVADTAPHRSSGECASKAAARQLSSRPSQPSSDDL